MRNRKDILAQHKFSISQVTEHRAGGDITRWRTHLPNAEGKKGKQIKKASRKDLEDAIVEFYRQRDKEDVLTFKDVYMEWREYHWQKNNSSNNTQDKYITDYFRYIHGQPLECMPITEISDQDLDSYFINTIRAEGIEYRTFGKLYGYISGTFKYAFKRRMIQSDPMSYLDKSDYRNTCVPKKEKTAESELIPDEDFNLILEQLYKDMQEHPTNFTYYAVELAAKMAPRVGEIATLKWSDIDFKHGVITVCRSDKYNKDRDENGNVISTGKRGPQRQQNDVSGDSIDTLKEALRQVELSKKEQDLQTQKLRSRLSDYLVQEQKQWNMINDLATRKVKELSALLSEI